MKGITPETRLIRTFLKLLQRDDHFKVIFQDQRHTKEMVVDRGNLLYASSNLLKDKLSEILFKAGKLTKEQYMLSTELSILTKKRMGEILIREGFLPKEDVVRGLRAQVRKVMGSLFEHPGWKVRVLTSKAKSSLSVVPGLSLLNAVMVGVRTIDNLAVLGEAMPSMDAVLEVADEGDGCLKKVLFTRDEHRLLRLIDGERTLREVYEASGMWEYRYYKTVYPLLALSVMKTKRKVVLREVPVASPVTAGTAGEAPLAEMKSPLPAGVEEKPPDREALFEEAKFFLSTERYSEAANRLKKLIGLDNRRSAYYYYLGLSLDHIPGQNKEAEKVFKIAIRLESYNARYYLALGYLYLNRRLYRQARQQFEAARQREPKDPYVQEALARLDRAEKKKGSLLTKKIF